MFLPINEVSCSYTVSFFLFFSFCPLKDDIGDKSVFMFNALPEEEEEKKVLARKLEQQKLLGA